jgi:hypothetical protein
VQFIPASESTQEGALRNARTAKYGNTETRIFSPEWLAAELLRSGRLKDYARVELLINSGKLDMNVFSGIVKEHRLEDKWNRLVNNLEQ